MQRKEDWAGLGIKPLMIGFAHNLPANKKKNLKRPMENIHRV